VGFMEYDVDSYVDKLENIIKKKLKMYSLLSKKVDNFKRYLKEEEEVRHKVKNINYY
jgi:flagellar biosynthesis chaperone FliJ